MEDEDEFKLNGDTMRNLEVLAHSPGELRFRMALVQGLKDLRKELFMMRVEMRGRLDKLENRRLIGEMQVAKIAKQEIKDDREIGQMKVDVKRLWTGAMWFVVLITGGVMAEGLRVLLGAPK